VCDYAELISNLLKLPYMINTFVDFANEILNMPTLVVIWVFFLVTVNLCSLFFIKRREGQITLLGFLLAGALMVLIFKINGFNKFLGIAHLIVWPPVLIYIFMRSKVAEKGSMIWKWMIMLLITNSISLTIDLIDVISYILGRG